METFDASTTKDTSWPPERGWPLFIAWMGGVLAVLLLSFVINFAGIAYRPQAAGWNDRVLWVLPGLAGHAWQAWLLFRGHPIRFGLWTALPLSLFMVPDPVRFMAYQSLLIPIAEAGILRSVRQRAWAWILASMAAIVLSSAFTFVAYSVGQSLITNLMNGVSAKLGPLASYLQVGLHQGIWLLGEGLCAAILAWKMPPVSPAPEAPTALRSQS
jgi:hypothetical protein